MVADTRPRIMLLGATGQVGRALQGPLAALGELRLFSRRGSAGTALDVTDLAALRAAIRQFRPALIVNATAYTAVDQAESEPDLALRINAQAPAVLSATAADIGASVVHYSTDYVYTGDGEQPFTEAMATEPLNVYGRTKLAGDVAIAVSGATHLIFRTSWVYSPYGNNFLLTMRRLMAERERLTVVGDQVGAPTPAQLIASVTADVLRQTLGENGWDFGMDSGVYHLCAAGSASWFDFASAIRALGGYDTELERIASADYPAAARRPLNSRLDCSKIQQRFGVQLPDWQAALAAVWKQLD